jgi:hypothetical protein
MSAGESARDGRGGQGRAVVCAGVGACCYCEWCWVLYMVWAWHRLDLHGIHNLSWGNFVNEIRFLSIFCIFCIFCILCICTGYQLIGMPCTMCSRRSTSWGVLKDFGLWRKAHVHGVEQP